jgi:tyrosyl-tRNA synthetase
MDAKVSLAKIVVTDFHSAEAAEGASEVFNAVVRRKEVPPDLQTVQEPEGVRNDAGGIRLDKLLAKIGLADSVSDAVRKIKAGAVEINGDKVKDLVLLSPPAEMIIQVGKNWRRVA